MAYFNRETDKNNEFYYQQAAQQGADIYNIVDNSDGSTTITTFHSDGTAYSTLYPAGYDFSGMRLGGKNIYHSFGGRTAGLDLETMTAEDEKSSVYFNNSTIPSQQGKSDYTGGRADVSVRYNGSDTDSLLTIKYMEDGKVYERYFTMNSNGGKAHVKVGDHEFVASLYQGNDGKMHTAVQQVDDGNLRIVTTTTQNTTFDGSDYVIDVVNPTTVTTSSDTNATVTGVANWVTGSGLDIDFNAPYTQSSDGKGNETLTYTDSHGQQQSATYNRSTGGLYVTGLKGNNNSTGDDKLIGDGQIDTGDSQLVNLKGETIKGSENWDEEKRASWENYYNYKKSGGNDPAEVSRLQQEYINNGGTLKDKDGNYISYDSNGTRTTSSTKPASSYNNATTSATQSSVNNAGTQKGSGSSVTNPSGSTVTKEKSFDEKVLRVYEKGYAGDKEHSTTYTGAQLSQMLASATTDKEKNKIEKWMNALQTGSKVK